MRLALLLTLVTATAHAQSVCDQHLVIASTSSGLSLSKDGDVLRLHYLGPTEPDIGRFWPMTASLVRRVLTVRLATASKPSSPSGATLPAFGENAGLVTLPKLGPGAWKLVVTQGKARAEWALDVTNEGWSLTVVRPHPTLVMSALDWKWRGEADAIAVRCTADGGCRDFFEAHRDARVADGAWLDLPWLGEETCWLRVDAGALPVGVVPVRAWAPPATSGGTPGAPR